MKEIKEVLRSGISVKIRPWDPDLYNNTVVKDWLFHLETVVKDYIYTSRLRTKEEVIDEYIKSNKQKEKGNGER